MSGFVVLALVARDRVHRVVAGLAVLPLLLPYVAPADSVAQEHWYLLAAMIGAPVGLQWLTLSLVLASDAGPANGVRGNRSGGRNGCGVLCPGCHIEFPMSPRPELNRSSGSLGGTTETTSESPLTGWR